MCRTFLPPYPTGSGIVSAAADAQLLAEGTAWEREIEKRYLRYLTERTVDPAISTASDYVALCAQFGLPAALLELNRRVPHRYTAAYRLDGQRLRNVELIDKAGEDRPEFLAEVPFANSFCQFVLRDGGFLTSDSGHDARLDGHPYKGVMVAYHGVPIADGEGKLLGTLCHFDVQQQPLSDAEFEHLQSVAQVIHRFLPH